MHKTKNDIPKETREKLIETLNARLADASDLKSQAKQAHWNVKGMDFIQLHELFDQVATQAEEYTDLIAERAVILGGTALGTVRVAASNSSLSEYPLEISAGADHVDALSNAHWRISAKKFAPTLRKRTKSAIRTRQIYSRKFRAELINSFGLSKRIFNRKNSKTKKSGLKIRAAFFSYLQNLTSIIIYFRAVFLLKAGRKSPKNPVS